MGLMIESLCRDNQKYNISNELLELPVRFLNKDEDLSIFPAGNKNAIEEIENKMQNQKFYCTKNWYGCLISGFPFFLLHIIYGRNIISFSFVLSLN